MDSIVNGKRNDRTSKLIFNRLAGFIVIAIFTLMAFSLYSVVGEKRPCRDNLRQLAMAALEYAHDHDGYLPGADWVKEIEQYEDITPNTFCCRGDSTRGIRQRVSYGYSGLLLRADGRGINIRQIPEPYKVGLFCKTAPTRAYPDGGIVGGGGLQPDAKRVVPDPRHGNGMNIACLDGSVFWNQFNERDHSNRIIQAFCLATVVQSVDNPVGGMRDFTPRVVGKGAIAIGGDGCTALLLRAAAAAWRQKAKVVVTNCGFAGQFAVSKRKDACVWGTGDGLRPSGNAVPIARDAVVVIVNKYSVFTRTKQTRAAQAPANPLMTYDTIRQRFGVNGDSTHIYTYSNDSGTRAFFTRAFGTPGKPLVINPKATIVKDDWEIVRKVASDDDRIGYCSASVLNRDDIYASRVLVVDLKLPDGSIAHYSQYEHSQAVSAHPTWPLMRTLYAVSTLPESNHFVDEMLVPGSPGNNALRMGPLFKASYYLPVP